MNYEILRKEVIQQFLHLRFCSTIFYTIPVKHNVICDSEVLRRECMIFYAFCLIVKKMCHAFAFHHLFSDTPKPKFSAPKWGYSFDS